MNDLSAGRNRPKGLSFDGWSSMSDTLAEGCRFGDESGRRQLDPTAQLIKLCSIPPFCRNRPRQRLARLV